MPKTFDELKEAFVADVRVAGRKTYRPVLVAFVGLTGVGASTVARELHRRLGWPVIEKNKIRVLLRQKGRGFTPATTNEVFYAAIGKMLDAGGSAILDADFVEKRNRRRIEKFIRGCPVRLVYMRLTCDEDTALERIMHSRHDAKTDIFASTAVALREHMRRVPWHYRWSEAGGGSYALRQLGIKFFAQIDTTRPAVWKKKVRAASERLKKM